MYDRIHFLDVTDRAHPVFVDAPGHARTGHSRVDPLLWGLLPDNEPVLQRWASRYHVSARNAFRLIEHVGEDCAGAVQFIQPERLKTFLSEPASRELTWLSEEDIAERLGALRADHWNWRLATDAGQFSLAGAQAKTALIFDGKRWGIPQGRTPATHILKPPTGQWDGRTEDEHFCLTLAEPAASSFPIHE